MDKKFKKRIYGVFDENGVCSVVYVINDPTGKPGDASAEEIKDKSLHKDFHAGHYKKVEGKIVKRTKEEIEKLENSRFIHKGK
jgi:hypothetical protein